MYLLIPRNCDYVILPDKKNFEDMSKLRILRWKITLYYLGYVITRTLTNNREVGFEDSKCDRATEAKSRERLEGALLLNLKMEESGYSQNMGGL